MSDLKTRLVFRPLTAVCLAGAVVLTVVSVVYFTKTANDLPSFLPGHAAGELKHHTKHGLATISLAVVALVGAWFTTAPSDPD